VFHPVVCADRHVASTLKRNPCRIRAASSRAPARAR
jgi:hypothetical protein